MRLISKKAVLGAALAVLLGIVTVVGVQAAAPDGLGPWADSVVGTSQGLRKDGTAVIAARSNPDAALGVAEDDLVDEHFYSLGFGGEITLGFENGISSGVIVVESTNLGYPAESADVALSTDGVTFTSLGAISQDGAVDVPDNFGCVQYVRITDTSNPDDFPDETADAYDVDGVEAQGMVCSGEGKMTGGGSILLDGTRTTHGFNLSCDVSKGGNLQMNWGKGKKFHLEELTSALCLDDPAVDEQNPVAPFNTYIGEGTGRFNGVSGYTVEFTFIDAGEPGVNDSAEIVIRDAGSNVVFSTNGVLQHGNHQAH